MKLQDELSVEREESKKFQNQVLSLKREIKVLRQNQMDLKYEKERCEELVEEYKREIQKKAAECVKEV